MGVYLVCFIELSLILLLALALVVVVVVVPLNLHLLQSIVFLAPFRPPQMGSGITMMGKNGSVTRMVKIVCTKRSAVLVRLTSQPPR